MLTRRSFNLLLGGLAASTAASALPAIAQGDNLLEQIKASGKLRVAGIPDGAPYYQKDLINNTWKGFYIDICQKLADDLGVKMDLIETTWGNSVLDLQAGKLDVFFGLNPTPQRAEIVDFSGPVFNNAFSFISTKPLEGKTWEDFNKPEFRIAVDAGSSHDAAVTRHCPNATISRLKTQSDATTALQSGRVDAQCLVLVIALTQRANNPSVKEVMVPTEVDAATSNAGFRKGADKAWQDFVNNWIEENRATGFVRDAIVRNMELVGVKESDFPEGLGI